MGRFVALLFGLISIAAFFACGGSSPAGVTIVPPVHASSGFTNANLSGGYAFGVSGATNNFIVGGSGVITADGNGNLTGGEETENDGGISCHLSLAGTYTVNSNGAGTATVTVTPDAASVAKGCGGGVADLSLALGNAGSSLILAGQDANSVSVVTAIKQ